MSCDRGCLFDWTCDWSDDATQRKVSLLRCYAYLKDANFIFWTEQFARNKPIDVFWNLSFVTKRNYELFFIKLHGFLLTLKHAVFLGSGDPKYHNIPHWFYFLWIVFELFGPPEIIPERSQKLIKIAKLSYQIIVMSPNFLPKSVIFSHHDHFDEINNFL